MIKPQKLTISENISLNKLKVFTPHCNIFKEIKSIKILKTSPVKE